MCWDYCVMLWFQCHLQTLPQFLADLRCTVNTELAPKHCHMNSRIVDIGYLHIQVFDHRYLFLIWFKCFVMSIGQDIFNFVKKSCVPDLVKGLWKVKIAYHIYLLQSWLVRVITLWICLFVEYERWTVMMGNVFIPVWRGKFAKIGQNI